MGGEKMIEFGASGLAVGWLAARRRPSSVLLFTVSFAGLALFVISQRFAAAALTDVLTFWIAVQIAWFLAQIVATARARRRREIVDDAPPLG